MNRSLLLGFALCLVAVGCGVNFPGSTDWPYGMSADKHNFVSTHNMPLNIELRDTVTDEALLMIHVPAGEMVVIKFKHEQDGTASPSGAMPANRVRWEIMSPDSTFGGRLENAMELAGHEVAIRVHVRDDPALPNGVDPRTGLMTEAARVQAEAEAEAEPDVGPPADTMSEPADPPSEPAEPAEPAEPTLPEPMPAPEKEGESDGDAEDLEALYGSGDSADEAGATEREPRASLPQPRIAQPAEDKPQPVDHLYDSNAPQSAAPGTVSSRVESEPRESEAPATDRGSAGQMRPPITAATNGATDDDAAPTEILPLPRAAKASRTEQDDAAELDALAELYESGESKADKTDALQSPALVSNGPDQSNGMTRSASGEREERADEREPRRSAPPPIRAPRTPSDD